jgi:hypothetical protein
VWVRITASREFGDSRVKIFLAVAALLASASTFADRPDESVQLLCEVDIKNISPRGLESSAHETLPAEVTRINNELSVTVRGQHLAFTMSMKDDRSVRDYSNNLQWGLLGGSDAIARNAVQRVLISRKALRKSPKAGGYFFYDWIETHKELPHRLIHQIQATGTCSKD